MGILMILMGLIMLVMLCMMWHLFDEIEDIKCGDKIMESNMHNLANRIVLCRYDIDELCAAVYCSDCNQEKNKEE